MSDLPLTEHHQQEALDRVHMLAMIFDAHVSGHPWIMAHPDLARRCEAVAEALGEIYQDIGQTEFGQGVAITPEG